MRVMTFNLRFENDTDGENAWSLRRDMAVAVIRRYSPDVLGTQEGRWPQLTYLCEHLPQYLPFLPDRLPDEKLQCPTLFFRKDRFQVHHGGDFWLSKTPQVHLSKDWDSAFPRMLSYAELKVENTAKSFIAAVTHLDHVGVEARYQQAKIIASWVGQQDLPVILMGDFNDGPSSPVHDVLTAPETGLYDTWEVLKRSETPEAYTHHGFTGIPRLARMDWILADFRFRVEDVQVVCDQIDGRYPSDHFPYFADFETAGM